MRIRQPLLGKVVRGILWSLAGYLGLWGLAVRPQELIKQHLAKADPRSSALSLDDLTLWYQNTRREIERQPVDDRVKRSQIAQLNVRYNELVQQQMEDLQP